MAQAVDPESEVRKLQELVKKLERQNVRLRGKQSEPDLMSESVTSINSTFSEISNASTISAPLATVRHGSGSRIKRTLTVEPVETPSSHKISAVTAAEIISDSMQSSRSRSELVMSCTSEPHEIDSQKSTKSSISSTGERNSPAPKKPPPAPPKVDKKRSKSAVGTKTDDCWLKKVEGEPKPDTILHWMREVFDRPTSDIVQAKQRLHNRLEEFRLTGRLYTAGSQPSLLNFELSNKLSHHKTLPDVRVAFQINEPPISKIQPSTPYIKPEIHDTSDSSCGSADSLEVPQKSEVATRKTSVLDIARQQEANLKAAVGGYFGRRTGSAGNDLNVISPHGSKQNLNQPIDASKRSVSGYQLDQNQRSISVVETFDDSKRSTSGQDLYQPRRPMATVQPLEDGQSYQITNRRFSHSGQPLRSDPVNHIDQTRRSNTHQPFIKYSDRSNNQQVNLKYRSQPQTNQPYRSTVNQNYADPSYPQNASSNQQSNQPHYSLSSNHHQGNQLNRTSPNYQYDDQLHQYNSSDKPRRSNGVQSGDRTRRTNSRERGNQSSRKPQIDDMSNPQAPPRRNRQVRVTQAEATPPKTHFSPSGSLDPPNNRHQTREQSPSKMQYRKPPNEPVVRNSTDNSDFTRSRGFRSVHHISENF